MRLSRTVLCLTVLHAFAALPALASGYHFGSQSASAQGTANASAAQASDPSVLFYNPAGMTRLEGTQASGVLDIVIPSTKFEDRGSVTSWGRPTGGGNGGDFVDVTAVPHAYLSHRLNDRLTAGFGVFVPFGSKTKYDEDWVGRYNIIGTELKTIALNPSVAFKVTDRLSLGAGISAQYMDGKLAKGADFGSGAMNSLVESQVKANAIPGVPESIIRAAVVNQLNGIIKTVSGNPTYSGKVDIKGDDWGFGYNLGLLFDIDDRTRIGVAYRSKIKHTLEGEAKWDVQRPADNLAALLNGALPGVGNLVRANLLAAYTDSPAKLKVTTPESLSISAFKQFERVALMADITRTRHSRFEELRVDFANNLPDSLTIENWEDTTRYSIGAEYQWSDKLKLRGGLAIDESPVDSGNRTPSIPDNKRHWLSGGLNWMFDKSSSLDLALSYIYLPKSQIDMYDNGGKTNAAGSQVCDSTRNTSSCATLRGRYDVSSWLLGMQYNHRF
ncbi:OmpP1/FadL family transporter [Chitinimonas naiadis]